MRLWCCFISRRDIVRAIEEDDPGPLYEMSGFLVPMLLSSPQQYCRGAASDADAESLLGLAAEKSPATFDVLWRSLWPEQRMLHEYSLGPSLAFIRRADEDRFFAVWHYVDVNCLSEHEKLMLLSTARDALDSANASTDVKLSHDDFDAGDRIMRAVWFRLNRNLELEDWAGSRADAAYVRWVLQHG